MSSAMGNRVRIQLFGQSHSHGLGVVIDGLPAGENIDMGLVEAFLLRRAGGRNAYSTGRAEPDAPDIVSGLSGGVTCGAPLCAFFKNTDARGGDYDGLKHTPRPSHADYTAFVKHRGHNDAGGGGHFSGRLTLPLCFAGAVCLQILGRRGVTIAAHISSIAGVADEAFADTGGFCGAPEWVGFPVINRGEGERMKAAIAEAAAVGDSVGGAVECGIWGLPPGLGEPIFDNLESRLAYAVFAIPAVKGVEFGAGFAAAGMRGSRYNDPFYMDNGAVRTATNNSGGILGGISSGMPVIFRAAFKPTPSISIPQKTVNLLTGGEAELAVKGRHDPCVVPRAVPCVEAAAAVTILDIVIGG